MHLDEEFERKFGMTSGRAFDSWWYPTSDLVRRNCPEHWQELVNRNAPEGSGTGRRQLVALLNTKQDVLTDIIKSAPSLDRPVQRERRRPWRRSKRTARLTLTADPDRPLERRPQALFGSPAHVPKIRLANEGSVPARGVRVEIVDFADATDGPPRPVRPWPRRPLQWPDGTSTQTPRDVEPGEVWLDLGYGQESGGEEDQLILFARESPERWSESLLPIFKPGTYRARVRATAHDADPADEEFVIRFDAWDAVSIRRDIITVYPEPEA